MIIKFFLKNERPAPLTVASAPVPPSFLSLMPAGQMVSGVPESERSSESLAHVCHTQLQVNPGRETSEFTKRMSHCVLYRRTEHQVYRKDHKEWAGPGRPGPLCRLTPHRRFTGKGTSHGERPSCSPPLVKPFFPTTMGATRKKEKLHSPSREHKLTAHMAVLRRS